MAAEYIVQVKKGNEVESVVIMAADRKTPTLTAATERGFHFASKFKSKDRAQAVAKKVNGEVVSSWGGFVSSTKSAVAPINNKVNSKTAFSQTMTAYRKNQY